MACELGRLYNKEAIIEKLLNDKSEGDNAGSDGTADHIKSLKVINLVVILGLKSIHYPSMTNYGFAKLLKEY